jgi:hypothetical protein
MIVFELLLHFLAANDGSNCKFFKKVVGKYPNYPFVSKLCSVFNLF